jgi:hypothetical protein
VRTLIYCDIDGVLHPWPCPPERMFDPVCIARLEGVLRPHAVDVVITSTWRLEWPLARLRERLGALGEYVVGVTPEIEDPFIRFGRYHEVLRHQEAYAPAGSHWVAIDDEPGRYPGGLENLILTNPRAGFAESDAARLRRLLGF